jgi:cell division protein FtsQ
MWDNPRLLNLAAGVLVGLVVLASTLTALHWLLRSPLFPLRVVELRTPLKQAAPVQVEAAIARLAAGNFFAVSIDELRAALERLPWIRAAAVRRVWPDRLEISIEEHVPLARWGAEALVNTHGERFAGASEVELPVFIGPPGTEAEVTLRYARFSQLLAPLGSRLERIALSPRHAWQLRLANGLQLTLGRDAELAEQRLARFVDAYVRSPDAADKTREVVDLRYPNGFALRVRGGA